MESKESSTQMDATKEESAPVDSSRRSLLRGSMVAMPALLTLQSGAALARSSNLIRASTSNTTDGYGRTLCLDADSVYRVPGSDSVYDAGEPAYGSVSAINDRTYFTEARSRSRRVSEAEMCKDGGTYYYRDRRQGRYSRKRWKSVDVKRGVIVSATALSSFGGAIHIYDL